MQYNNLPEDYLKEIPESTLRLLSWNDGRPELPNKFFLEAIEDLATILAAGYMDKFVSYSSNFMPIDTAKNSSKIRDGDIVEYITNINQTTASQLQETGVARIRAAGADIAGNLTYSLEVLSLVKRVAITGGGVTETIAVVPASALPATGLEINTALSFITSTNQSVVEKVVASATVGSVDATFSADPGASVGVVTINTNRVIA